METERSGRVELDFGTDSLLAERVAHSVVLTINRPDVLNAIDAEVSAAIGRALARCNDDPGVRAVIITGAGTKAFCAGGDLSLVRDGVRLDGERGFAEFVRHYVDVPVIAAVNGWALGGGLELVLASDLAICATTARFGLPEVRVGVYASGGGPFRLPRQIPAKVAMEMMLTGEAIDAEEAHLRGLVSRVVPPQELMQEALMLGERIARSAPLAVRAMKRIARGSDGSEPEREAEDWERTHREGEPLLATRDSEEGILAFLEKRPPRWTAR